MISHRVEAQERREPHLTCSVNTVENILFNHSHYRHKKLVRSILQLRQYDMGHLSEILSHTNSIGLRRLQWNPWTMESISVMRISEKDTG